MNVPPKGAKRRLAFVLLLGFWSFKFFLGLIAFLQHRTPENYAAVKGFPGVGDVEFYLLLPVALMAVNVLMIRFSSNSPKWFATIAAMLQLFLILALLFLAGGGV